MRRRLLAVIVGGLLALTIAGPAFADTVPGPGNFRDSGDRVYLSAFGSVCGQSTCTDTNVFADATDLQGGDSFVSICVDQFTYPIRGGGRFRSLFGCAEVAPDIAADLSSGSAAATFSGESCGRRSCTTVQITLSVSLTATAAPNAYSFTEKRQFENCIDTFRVRGEVAPAEGTIVLNGSSIDTVFGEIGAESFAFSTRCR